MSVPLYMYTANPLGRSAPVPTQLAHVVIPTNTTRNLSVRRATPMTYFCCAPAAGVGRMISDAKVRYPRLGLFAIWGLRFPRDYVAVFLRGSPRCLPVFNRSSVELHVFVYWADR